MATCCAPACSQALPVKPQGVWARGSEAWAGSRDLRNLEFVRWGSSGPSSLMSFSISLENWFWNVFVVAFNTLRPRQNGRHFPDDIFKYISLNENVWIPMKISLKFVPKGPANNIPALVQIMAWRRSGDEPLSEPMMGDSLTHICVTRPQWVKQCLIET